MGHAERGFCRTVINIQICQYVYIISYSPVLGKRFIRKMIKGRKRRPLLKRYKSTIDAPTKTKGDTGI